MPGKSSAKARKHITSGRLKTYESLKKKMSKRSAARIANAGKTKQGRSKMARKAARSWRSKKK